MYRNSICYNKKNAMIVIANDISDKARHIETIEAQNKKLLEISWVQSHIVRAPLARALGCLQLLKSDALTDDDRDQLIDMLMISANEFDRVIIDIAAKSQSAESGFALAQA